MSNQTFHQELSEDEWIRLFRKRSYYATEIAELIFNLPAEQARAAKEKLFEILADVSLMRTKFEEISKIPQFARLAMLHEKFDQNLCCYPCAMATMIGAFLKTKCDSEVGSPVLH